MKKTRDEVRTEALGAIRKFLHAGAAISMGVGKTRLGLDHFQLVMNKLIKSESREAKALVAAPTKKIIQGWKEEALKWGMESLLEHITFTTYRSLEKQSLDYDVVYLDECHSLTMSHDPWLREFKGYIIGLTGTPPDPRSTKGKLVAIYCPIVYTYITDEAIADNILNDYKITVHLLELDTDKTHQIQLKDGRSWYTSEYENYMYWTDRVMNSFGKQKMQNSVMRMKAMHIYRTKEVYGKKLLDKAKDKCILFANEQKQADRLCMHSYHSSNKDSERNMEWFETGKIDKLSCVLQLSEGANIPGLKESIILHAYGNNKKTAQRLNIPGLYKFL